MFDHFQKYIWYRLEDVPLELIAARIAWANAATKKEEAWQRKMDEEEHLAQVQADLSAMEDGELVDSDEEFKLQAAVVKVAKDSLALAKRQLKKREQELAKKKSDLAKFEKNTKEYGKTTRSLWMKIQDILKKEFDVYVSVYHGGALEGNQARRLLRSIVDIMARIKPVFIEFLSTLSPSERNERADKDELDLYCGGFQRLFQYMDLISHFCYQPFGSMSDADVNSAKLCIKLATKL